MKWFTLGLAAPLAGAALLILTDPPARSDDGRCWEPAEAVAWADPAGGQLSCDLNVQQVQAWSRSETKGALTAALLRGDLTLAEAAEQFRATNAGAPMPYARLQDDYPQATEEELSYRQVLLFVQGQLRLRPEAVTARLPGLRAEVARRFPSAGGPVPPAAG